MNMEIATILEVEKFSLTHNQSTGWPTTAHLNATSWLRQLSNFL